MRALGFSCVMCATLSSAVGAQEMALMDGVERGSTGIGSHLSVLFLGESGIRSGVEVGYSRVGRVEEEASVGAVGFASVLETRTSSTRLWHASFVARRHWPTASKNAKVYAVAGTGGVPSIRLAHGRGSGRASSYAPLLCSV